jgi:hypothetical protein
MTCVIVGPLLRLEGSKLVILDKSNNQTYTCSSSQEEAFDSKIGEDAIWIGDEINDQITVRKYSITKILNPLYETDVLESSGHSFIEVMEDPFQAIKTALMHKYGN